MSKMITTVVGNRRFLFIPGVGWALDISEMVDEGRSESLYEAKLLRTSRESGFPSTSRVEKGRSRIFVTPLPVKV
jgi:hypothetical protein